MNGKDVVQMAINHEKPPRIPVALVAGGEWYVHLAGKTFVEIKNDPEQIAGVFIDAFRKGVIYFPAPDPQNNIR